MPRMKSLMGRLACIITVGTMFQATGCTVDSAGLLSGFVTTFVNFAINNFVNAQLGVSGF